MTSPHFDCVVVGGGIVGLSVAHQLLHREPGLRLAVVDKEPDLARHQTGRNSGVIHSGIYYRPGSLKARLARAGAERLIQFCREHGLAHEICGKLIVANGETELPRLRALLERGHQNGLNPAWLTPEAAREIEPHVQCRAAVRVPETGIVSYRDVCAKLAELLTDRGGTVRWSTELLEVRKESGGLVLVTSNGDYGTRFLVNCGGLHSDRIAHLAGARPEARIIPFRGEYYELVPTRRSLVRALIYPVPDPAFPFLGVHFTRMIDGSIHAGPNAVLAFKREGYQRSDFNLRDVWETAAYPGFWKLVARHGREGLHELHRSFSKVEFVRSLQRLIPAVQEDDLVPANAGVRAQALSPDGRLVDDFLLVRDERALHVLNAPSPAATASLAIGEEVARQLPSLRASVMA